MWKQNQVLQGVPKNASKIVWIKSPVTNMLKGWDISHLKGGGVSVTPSAVQKHFSTISESQDKSKTILGYFFEEFEMMNNLISGSPQDLFIIFLVWTC